MTATLPSWVVPAEKPTVEEQGPGGVSVETLASGLVDPVGIALDPSSGVLFIAEPSAGRIVAMLGSTLIGSFRSDFRIANLPAPEAQRELDHQRWRYARLRLPVDLAFDRKGWLYVAESAPGSRILAFDVRNSGFTTAEVVACPTTGQARVYSYIAFDEQDHLCALSYNSGRQAAAPQMEVFVRDATGTWTRSAIRPVADFPFPSNRVVGPLPSAGTGANGARKDPVLGWLYANPSLGRMTMDPATCAVYATMRGLGTVVRVQRNLPMNSAPSALR